METQYSSRKAGHTTVQKATGYPFLPIARAARNPKGRQLPVVTVDKAWMLDEPATENLMTVR
jgi:hypothetical protein